MPRLKQPNSLQKLAFDSLVGYMAGYCDALSVEGLLTELREIVAAFRQYVRDNVPDILFAEFCRKFLAKFYSIGNRRWEEVCNEISKRVDPTAKRPSEDRPASHHRAALEIMMDVKAAGLTCEGWIIQYLDPSDVHRIQGLRVLNWKELPHCEHVPRGLKNYRLQDLTTFIIPTICTDLDLEIIGPRCLKLETLNIDWSKKVTDKGLRALRPCSELRVINIHYCPVSDEAVNELLDCHRKLEQFNVGSYFEKGEKSFDVLSRPISLVCPSVKRFAFKPYRVTNAHLSSVVALFPNLSYLEFCRPITGDLRLLKDLRSLEGLKFSISTGAVSMENLKELLTSVGANISLLVLEGFVYTRQNDINFIFKVCPDVERLHFFSKASRPGDKLIIPPFQKLKHLQCIAVQDSRYPNDYRVELDFCKMLSLEDIGVQGFQAIFEMTESMMLDDVKFPNLREVRTFFNRRDPVERINQTANNKNLDFSIQFAHGDE